MKNFTILLAFLPIFLGAQNISVKSFNLLQGDMEARVNAPVQDQNGDKCAIIKMVTSEKGFMFEGDMNGITKTEYKTGEYWIYLPYGSKKLTLKHEKLGVLRNYVYPISIKEATVYEMVLTTAKVTTIVEEYEVLMQWFTIASEPVGADVYINDKYVGITPFQKKMEVGKYNYRIEKNMYLSSAGATTLAEDKTEALNITLKPNFGYVKINSTPESGASVEITGRADNGTTPFTSQALPVGKYSVTIKKVMFSPKHVEFEIIAGQNTELNVDLIPDFANLTIQTTPSADIYIDDVKKGTGTYTGRVMPGLHTLEAKKDKYNPDKKQMEFVAGEDKTISLHPLAKTGNVDIMTTPFGATIKIDDKDKGVTPTTLKDLLIGTYNLSLTKTGYGTITKTITITQGQTTTVNETLPSGKQITINSEPQGATLYIAGQSKGLTPQTLTLGFGDHALKLVNGKKTVEQIITVSQTGKSSWSFDVSEFNGVFTDSRDGKTYKAVQIGSQIWMAENLNYKTTDSYCYGDNASNCQKYGRLYIWQAAKKACPSGWHLPTDAEWKLLEKQLGMSQTDLDNTGWRGTNQGKELKATSGWNSNGNGTDSYGFAALPGGYRDVNGGYDDAGNYGTWWSATEYDTNYAFRRELSYSRSNVYRYYSTKPHSFSVRCLRD